MRHIIYAIIYMTFYIIIVAHSRLHDMCNRHGRHSKTTHNNVNIWADSISEDSDVDRQVSYSETERHMQGGYRACNCQQEVEQPACS